MSLRKFCLTPDNTRRLIKEVKTRECLWNTENENYNDRYHVICAWRDIAKIFDVPEDVLKLKWKNLRDLFRREIKKHKFSTVEEYPGRWKYFEHMWFINKPDDVTQEEENDNECYEIEALDDDVESFPEATIKFEPLEDMRNHEVFLKEDRSTIPAKMPKYSERDYDMMYLQSLTPFFSQLDPIRKLVVRSKIHDLLLNEIAAQAAYKNKK